MLVVCYGVRKNIAKIFKNEFNKTITRANHLYARHLFEPVH